MSESTKLPTICHYGPPGGTGVTMPGLTEEWMPPSGSQLAASDKLCHETTCPGVQLLPTRRGSGAGGEDTGGPEEALPKITALELAGLRLIEPVIHRDERGYFCEAWHTERYAELGLPAFVQDNVSWSRKGALRGLHFQLPCPQGKLVFVPAGEVYDVAVDIRPSSPTFGGWVGVPLSAATLRQPFLPPGLPLAFA